MTVALDWDANFEPIILPKGQSRFTEFNYKIIALYARGIGNRDIQAYLEEIYVAEVMPTPISKVSRAIQDEIVMDEFSVKWDDTHPTISCSWRCIWERLTPLFSYPMGIRRAI